LVPSAGRGALDGVASARAPAAGRRPWKTTNLASGANYSGFADLAYFPVVTDAWQAVVVPNAVLFIGVLAVFEATVGVLALCAGRWTRLGYAGVIAFYLALWVFGWMETVWVLLMLAPMMLLLRAERRAAPGARAKPTPMAEVGS
jgi:hypothetical protein